MATRILLLLLLFLCSGLCLFFNTKGNSIIAKTDSIHHDLLSQRKVFEINHKTLTKSFEVKSYYSIFRLPLIHAHCSKILWLVVLSENQQWIVGGEGQVISRLPFIQPHRSKILWLGVMSENQPWIVGGEGQAMTNTTYRQKGEVSPRLLTRIDSLITCER